MRTSLLKDPEAIALRALGFVASRRTELERLLSYAGVTHADVQHHPIDPEILGAILDFLIVHEATLLEFSRRVDLPPEAAYEARRLVGQIAAQKRRLEGRAGHRPRGGDVQVLNS